MSLATVDVHWTRLDARVGRIEGALRLLDPGERSRAERFRFDRDRRRFVLRRAWLRERVADYLGRDPTLLSIGRGTHGKPVLDREGLWFNASHSRGVALLAVSRDTDLGCDVEWRNPRLSYSAVAEGLFAPDEVRALRDLSPGERSRAFFRCWTRKEACVKADGRGLFRALDSFSVSVGPDEPARVLRGLDGWSMRSFEPLSNYEAAVVARAPEMRLNLLAS